VKYFKYFGSIVTNDLRYTREIKSKFFIEKSAFKSKKENFSPENWTRKSKRGPSKVQWVPGLSRG